MYLHLDLLEHTLIVDGVVLEVWVLSELEREIEDMGREERIYNAIMIKVEEGDYSGDIL
jgi:hypothetical protein